MVNRESIRKQLPHGSCIVIAKKAGVTTKAVSEYFAGKTNSQKVENAALAVLADLKKEKAKLLKAVL